MGAVIYDRVTHSSGAFLLLDSSNQLGVDGSIGFGIIFWGVNQGRREVNEGDKILWSCGDGDGRNIRYGMEKSYVPAGGLPELSGCSDGYERVSWKYATRVKMRSASACGMGPPRR